jgi:hypothetical protein
MKNAEAQLLEKERKQNGNGAGNGSGNGNNNFGNNNSGNTDNNSGSDDDSDCGGLQGEELDSTLQQLGIHVAAKGGGGDGTLKPLILAR